MEAWLQRILLSLRSNDAVGIGDHQKPGTRYYEEVFKQWESSIAPAITPLVHAGEVRWAGMLIRRTGTSVIGINRRGLRVSVPGSLLMAARGLREGFLIEGGGSGREFLRFRPAGAQGA